jgi:hypothetical protein
MVVCNLATYKTRLINNRLLITKQLTMKLILVTIALSLFGIQNLNAQATDFTVNDCDGVSHHLFGELDAGKVIVIAWVMPCGSCAAPSLAAYNAVQSFASSHPGQVEFYLVDDYANSSCSTIQGWGNNNSMTEAITFSNAAISMSDYGTNGMPKIVVLGGIDHVVAYNKNSGVTTQDVQTAISSILDTQSTLEIELEKQSVQIAPNPVSSELNLILNNIEPTAFIIYDLNGEIIQEGTFSPNQTKIQLNNSFTTGHYLLKISSNMNEATIPFNVL